MERILITGGAGFVGTNLIQILNKKYIIDVIDNLSTSAVENVVLVENTIKKNGGVFYKICVTSNEAKQIASNGIYKAIVHLAAITGVLASLKDPMLDAKVNILGTLNLLNAISLKSSMKFIAASSSAPLGSALPPHNENTFPAPDSPYGVSKLAMEKYIQTYSDNFKIKGISLRFANLYGPHSQNKTSIIPQHIKNGLSKKEIVLEGDGSVIRDFLFVGDICELIDIVINKNVKPGVYHASSDCVLTTREITQKITGIFEADGIDITVKNKKARESDILVSCPDSTLIRREVGWCPQISIDTGLRITFDSFKEIMS